MNQHNNVSMIKLEYDIAHILLELIEEIALPNGVIDIPYSDLAGITTVKAKDIINLIKNHGHKII